MIDQEPTQDLEVRFAGLQHELIAQIGTTYQEDLQKYKGVVVRIVSNEWDGKSEALLLGSDGKWSGKMDMMGWNIGEKPQLNELLEDYAEIKEPDFQRIKDEEYKAEMAYSHGASPEVDRIMDMRINKRGANEVKLTPEEQTLLDAYHEGRETLEQEWKVKKQTYVTKNRIRLSEGLFGEMERVLKELSEPQQPKQV